MSTRVVDGVVVAALVLVGRHRSGLGACPRTRPPPLVTFRGRDPSLRLDAKGYFYRDDLFGRYWEGRWVDYVLLRPRSARSKSTPGRYAPRQSAVRLRLVRELSDCGAGRRRLAVGPGNYVTLSAPARRAHKRRLGLNRA